MTYAGGADAAGNIFSVGINGSGFQDFYDFTGGIDGQQPCGDLTLSDGTLFGMTQTGGANGYGTVFALALPVPEPGSLALLAVGVLGLLGYGWRRSATRTAKPTALDQPDAPAILSFR